MKKISLLLVLVLVVFSMTSCGGQGAGSSSSPPVESPYVPAVIELRPSLYIAQTNSFIYISARVLNVYGNPIENISVTFTKLSGVGTLSSNFADTDSLGYAEVTLSSTTSGFSTLQAEVDTGTGQIRDQKTVYFSTYSLALLPSMILDVDDDPYNGIYNEPDDFILLQDGEDNTVIVRATVFDGYDNPVSNSIVTFGTDSTEASFLNDENIKTTNNNGQAFAYVVVNSTTIRDFQTVLNVTASADNGAANMVTLFLEPVTVTSITVFADPSSIEAEGTSTITANVLLNTGNPVSDGTTVSFTTTCGSVAPFAQTTDGVAEATFTAPSAADTCTITATAGGESGSTIVTVTALPDTTSPLVTTTIPADEAVDISPDSTVTINWSENIDCTTVNTTNITILPAPTTWTRTSCSGSAAVFTPTGQSNDTEYTVTVTTAVTDLAGNPMTVAYMFSYTTTAP